MESGNRKGRPNYSPEFKHRLAMAACDPGVLVSKLARDHGINTNMLFKWRRDLRAGLLTDSTTEDTKLLPVVLYVIEADIRGKPPDERREVRRARSRPLLDDLHRCLRTAFDTLSSKSDTAAAILYALKLWPALLRYCDNGAIEIDNSAAERALRGVAIGRRDLLTDRHSQAERCRPRSLMVSRANAYRRSSHQTG